MEHRFWEGKLKGGDGAGSHVTTELFVGEINICSLMQPGKPFRPVLSPVRASARRLMRWFSSFNSRSSPLDDLKTNLRTLISRIYRFTGRHRSTISQATEHRNNVDGVHYNTCSTGNKFKS